MHDSLVSAMIAGVARQLQGLAGRQVEFSGLGTGQMAVLEQIVGLPGLTHDMVRARLGVTPATVTRAVQHLEKAQLVRRETRPRDRRTFGLFPTGLALAIVKVAHDGGDTPEDILLQGFGDEEKRLAARLLGRMAANLARAEEGPRLPGDL